jgi:hypothetical protein
MRNEHPAWFELQVFEHIVLGKNDHGFCEHCNSEVEFVVCTPSMTVWQWDGTGEDPNRDLTLCIAHAEEHMDYMSELWTEYNSGRV